MCIWTPNFVASRFARSRDKMTFCLVTRSPGESQYSITQYCVQHSNCMGKVVEILPHGRQELIDPQWHIQYHSCWWSSDARNQGINSCGIDRVHLKYSCPWNIRNPCLHLHLGVSNQVVIGKTVVGVKCGPALTLELPWDFATTHEIFLIISCSKLNVNSKSMITKDPWWKKMFNSVVNAMPTDGLAPLCRQSYDLYMYETSTWGVNDAQVLLASVTSVRHAISMTWRVHQILRSLKLLSLGLK